MLLYNWPLVLATYSVYVSPFDWFVICLILRSTRYFFIDSRVSFCLVYVLTIVYSTCHHLICTFANSYVKLVCNLFTTQIHTLLFHWFTCLLLFGLCIDYCLVYVSPFDLYLCELIRQIIIFKFRTNKMFLLILCLLNTFI